MSNVAEVDSRNSSPNEAKGLMLSLNAEFLHHHGNDVGSDTARNYLTKTYAFISIILYSLHAMEVQS